MYNSAWYANEQGCYVSTFAMATPSIAARSEQLGEESDRTLLSIAMIASTYRNQGCWTEADQQEAKMVEKRKLVLRGEHPSKLTIMANLASTHWNQGR